MNRSSSGEEEAAARRAAALNREWRLCFHYLSACFAVLDETASTHRLGGTPFGRSHSPTSALLHRHHSFSCASNRDRCKSTATWQNALMRSGDGPGITRKSGDARD
jgi:hypothetical protein